MHPLWINVDKKITDRSTGCWLMTTCLNYKGYGVITRKHIKAHRISWEHHFGPIPIGLLVLHHCDVRNCVNPKHLFIGTAKQNSEDMMRKGRNKYDPAVLAKGRMVATTTLKRDWHGRLMPNS